MNDTFLDVAKQAALEAGKIIQNHTGGEYRVGIKNDNPSDLVTKVDLEAEKIIIKIIKAAFPDHNIIAEETGSKDQASDYTWIVDPLDGTTSFVAQIPSFAVAIALMYKNQPILGVVNLVGQNKLVWAQKDKGAYVDGKRIEVTKTNNLEVSLIGFDFGKTKYRQLKLDRYFFAAV